MTEVTEQRDVAQVLRDGDGNVLAAGADEIARYYEQQKASQRAALAGRGRMSFAERLAEEAGSPPAARTAQQEAKERGEAT